MQLNKYKILCFFLCLGYMGNINAQHKSDTLTDWDRTFMPAVQMDYVHYSTAQLSGGLMVQTSIEYRHQSNFVLRANYDDFDATMRVEYPIDPDLTYTGRMSFFEFIGGIGYRDRDGKHNFTGYVQGGIRNYGYPVFTSDSLHANIDFNNRNVGIMRYSLGYEFALAPKLFLTIETLVSHTLTAKDFWADNRWSYGATIGISAPLF